MSSNGNAPAARLKKTELFEPLNIRGLQLQNHIVVAPMGMYSSPGGHLTDFHLMHHGQFALRGVGLTMVEVTAVTANGRSSPLDAGIWDDSHIPSFRKVVDFVHGIEGGNGRIAIQLGHAGRRGSMMPVYPGKKLKVAFKQDDGWEDEVWGASPVPFSDMFVVPKEMSLAQVKAVVDAFGDAAERSVKAGFGKLQLRISAR
jgi:2,4-dienoyl-CoA reductase-like NADH-dependent reductase (Old Yellow Enzyme family)